MDLRFSPEENAFRQELRAGWQVELRGRCREHPGAQLAAREHAVVDRDLHAEPVEQRREAPRRGVRIGAAELTAGDAFPDHRLEPVLPRDVELLADVLQRRVAQRLAPRVDPQHPSRLRLLRGVEVDRAGQLDERARRVGQLRLQP